MVSAARRTELVHALESAKADIEKLLVELGETQLTEPGINGEWSMKDILAHVTAWEERPVAWAEALANHTRPTPAPWSGDLSEEQVNDFIYQSNRARPPADVLEKWRTVHDRVMEAIAGMTDDELFDRKVDWLGDASFAEAIPGNSYEHLRIHESDIRAWLSAH